jgi:hypothetical protein
VDVPAKLHRQAPLSEALAVAFRPPVLLEVTVFSVVQVLLPSGRNWSLTVWPLKPAS